MTNEACEFEENTALSKSELNCLVMHNSHGDIPVGTQVWFRVENANMWAGDTEGILAHDGIEFVIDTKRSGRITINKGYDAYLNTIRPVCA